MYTHRVVILPLFLYWHKWQQGLPHPQMTDCVTINSWLGNNSWCSVYVCENCGLCHTLMTYFSFFSTPTPLHSSLYFSFCQQNQSTEQWWHQSGWPIVYEDSCKAQHSKMTSLKKKTKPAEIPRNPFREIFASLLPLFLPDILPPAFFYKTPKKRRKNKDRHIPMRWLTMSDRHIWRTIFSKVGRSLMHASVNRS